MKDGKMGDKIKIQKTLDTKLPLKGVFIIHNTNPPSSRHLTGFQTGRRGLYSILNTKLNTNKNPLNQ